MPQDGLISYPIEGNDRWRFLCEIRIRNVDDWPESVVREIGAEDDRVHVRVNAERVDRDIRTTVQGGFHLVNDVVAIDRRRPAAINHVIRERINRGKRAPDMEHVYDLFVLDQAD